MVCRFCVALGCFFLGGTLSAEEPGAGKRVAITSAEYEGTEVHHMLYLPKDWTADWKEQGKSWPVICEYAGNWAPALGSTGKVKDAALATGLSDGRYICVTLPFVAADGQSNALTWWGDEEATASYARMVVPRICEKFGGDAEKVLLCGFSRGAIAVNYIGLRDDGIAKLWCGFLTHDHYDGVREWKTGWGAPLEKYRREAAERLKRLNGRPVLICQNGSTRDIAGYLESAGMPEKVTLLDVDTERILGAFPNEYAKHPHTDRWMVKDSRERRAVRAWLDDVFAE